MGALGPGDHVLRVAEGGSLPAGIYWLTLTQGTDQASKRLVAVE